MFYYKKQCKLAVIEAWQRKNFFQNGQKSAKKAEVKQLTKDFVCYNVVNYRD